MTDGVKLTFAICAWTPLALSEATAFWAAAGLSKSTKPYPVHTHTYTHTMEEKADKKYYLTVVVRYYGAQTLPDIQA